MNSFGRDGRERDATGNFRVGFGDYVLDEGRFSLERHGVDLAVQPLVLRLMLYLVKHRQRVVGVDELRAEVWDGAVVGDGSIHQAILLARRALGDNSRQSWIRTVRKRGFRFVGEVTVAKVRPLLAVNHVAGSDQHTHATA